MVCEIFSFLRGRLNHNLPLPTLCLSSEKLASPDCTSVYQPPKSTTQSHICLYLLRASYHPSFLPQAPPGGGLGQFAADQLACECSECAQYLLRCSNETITETETLVTDIELYDKRKHPKERKLFNSETPEVRPFSIDQWTILGTVDGQWWLNGTIELTKVDFP